MHTGRLEAFSDGVFAIIITIMVLELHAPMQPTLTALRPMVPAFLSYVLSFRFRGDLLEQPSSHVSAGREDQWPGAVANLMLLFWLSLVPFQHGMVGKYSFREMAGVHVRIAAAAQRCVVRMDDAHSHAR